MTTATIAAGTSVPGKGYRIEVHPPHDREITTRDTVSRWTCLICIPIITALVPVMFATYWGAFIGPFFAKLGFLAGVAIAAALLTKVMPRLLVSNPEWTGYVTLDPFKGENIPYGPGLHPTLPWEERNADGNYPLEVITKTFEVTVQTRTARVIVRGVFEYQIHLPNLTTFIGIAESTIDEGFTAFIETFLLEELAERTAAEALLMPRVLNEILDDEFMGVVAPTGETITDFERENGIRAVTLVVTKIELPAAAQKTHDAIDEGKALFGVVAALLGITEDELKTKRSGTPKEISDERYDALLDQAMAISENAEMKIVKGNVGAALTNTLFGGNSKK